MKHRFKISCLQLYVWLYKRKFTWREIFWWIGNIALICYTVGLSMDGLQISFMNLLMEKHLHFHSSNSRMMDLVLEVSPLLSGNQTLKSTLCMQQTQQHSFSTWHTGVTSLWSEPLTPSSAMLTGVPASVSGNSLPTSSLSIYTAAVLPWTMRRRIWFL